MAEKVCVICERKFTEFGNNARPIAAGRWTAATRKSWCPRALARS